MDNEREWLFLASLFQNPKHLTLAQILVDVDSLSTIPGIIYRTIKEVVESASEVTPEVVAYHLNDRQLLSLIGGVETLDRLKQQTFQADDAVFQQLCNDIVAASKTRDIKTILTKLSTSDLTGDALVNAVINELYLRTSDEMTGLVSIDDALQESSGRFPISGTNIDGLDQIIGGLVPAEYLIIAARPSVGKTALATQIAVHSALEGIPTLYVSMEQSRQALTQRIRCVVDDESVLHNIPLLLNCHAGVTVNNIISITQTAQMLYGVQVVVVDYIGLLRGRKAGQSQNDFITFVSQQLQTMTRRLGVTAIVLSQLNRDSEREAREPALYDLRDSGSLEQDADIVMFLHRPQRAERAKLIVAKHREGCLGSVELRFEAEKVRFNDISSQ